VEISFLTWVSRVEAGLRKNFGKVCGPRRNVGSEIPRMREPFRSVPEERDTCGTRDVARNVPNAVGVMGT